MYGIKETTDGVNFFAELANGVVRSIRDGIFSWFEVVEFKDAAGLLPAAVNGAKEIPKEITDLDEAEARTLAETFAARLDLDLNNPQAERLAERGVAIGLQVLSYFNEIREFRAAAVTE